MTIGQILMDLMEAAAYIEKAEREHLERCDSSCEVHGMIH